LPSCKRAKSRPFVPDYFPTTNQYTINGCNMTYDASGNVTNDCNYSYTWDVYGNPVGGNGLIYDAMNRLVEISPGEQILYSPIGKLGLMNGQSVDDLWFPLPGGSSEELLGPYGANRHTLHSDWLGNVRLATTYSDRSLAYDVAYSPYGENYVPEGGSSSDVYFTGQRQQIAGGLFDFPYREYSIVGRWISPDPAGLNAVDITNPQSWNRYAYALNNPLRYTDPLGLFCFYGGAGDTPDNDSDPTDYDFGASGPDDCGNASQWINTSATVTVNGDGSDGPTFEDGQQIFPETVPYYDPTDVPLSPSAQAAVLAIHNAVANIPNPCAIGVQVSVGNASATASLSDSGAQGQVSYGQLSLGQVESQTMGTPLIPAPPSWLPDSAQNLLTSPVNAQMQGSGVLSVNASKSVKKATVQGWLNFACN
jgi:RHS repeat-associated protein